MDLARRGEARVAALLGAAAAPPLALVTSAAATFSARIRLAGPAEGDRHRRRQGDGLHISAAAAAAILAKAGD